MQFKLGYWNEIKQFNVIFKTHLILPCFIFDVSKISYKERVLHTYFHYQFLPKQVRLYILVMVTYIGNIFIFMIWAL